jgi:hypothetical protein
MHWHAVIACFYQNTKKLVSQVSSASVVCDYGLDDWCLICDRGKGFSFQPFHLDQFWGPI